MDEISGDSVEKALGEVEEFESLGHGGQGHVWRVKQAGQEKVVKVIPGDTDPVRVEREVDALRTIQSDRVMGFFGTFTVSHDGKDWPAIEGEYISGGTVAKRIAGDEQPSSDEALACCLGVLEGIQALHDHGLVHRDVKPQNVAFRNGEWDQSVVLDLGLVRDLEDSITRYPNLVGTLPYMAPEQLRLERAVKRTDVFGVGAMLMQLLTGELPYVDQEADVGLSAADWRRAMLERVDQAGWPRWARVRDEIDEDIASLLAQLLAEEAYNRPSVPEAIRLLQGLIADRSS